ncbi:MAG: hypothetical protein A2091_07195 [Desulfuromonadales bacterium GWD2_61_12]|nr:MAG: hypothetical protein A2005_01845 [Desulfuromonadales bacterium GWC2_61_20]OGR33294.1 MAG: hypothetical protein A2091_07195 [Desulfuromonadales bacterium GWD2_61_12]HAD04336.1 hypothetical protein [Desulfuromonas sp.]HBT83370.1 hypothetical protein [Desulfuromonas sp.]
MLQFASFRRFLTIFGLSMRPVCPTLASDFIGSWANVDADAQGITRIALASLSLPVFGGFT